MSTPYPLRNKAVDLLDEIEWPGAIVTREQINMAALRYVVARERVESGTVLEVGCGPGVGFRILLDAGLKVIGGDLRERALRTAQRNYGTQVPLIRFDAHAVPFGTGVLSGILLYEMLYYCSEPQLVLAECNRVLADHGQVIICAPNPQSGAFRRSHLGTNYLSASQMEAILEAAGFQAEVFGAFRISEPPEVRKVLTAIRAKAADGLSRTPAGLVLKRYLKAALFGNRFTLPTEVMDGDLKLDALTSVVADSDEVSYYRVLYAIGVKRSATLNMASI